MLSCPLPVLTVWMSLSVLPLSSLYECSPPPLSLLSRHLEGGDGSQEVIFPEELLHWTEAVVKVVLHGPGHVQFKCQDCGKDYECNKF